MTWFSKKFVKRVKETEYTFVWFKKMQNGKRMHYTKPFRTKVTASSFEEAKKKVEEFAMSKMKLIVLSEDEYNRCDIRKFQEDLDKVFGDMDKIFREFKHV